MRDEAVVDEAAGALPEAMEEGEEETVVGEVEWAAPDDYLSEDDGGGAGEFTSFEEPISKPPISTITSSFLFSHSKTYMLIWS